MAQITCVFQGALTIPLFKTPYTVTMPGTYPQGINRYSVLNGYGDTALIGEIYNHIAGTLGGPNTIYGGEAVAMRYANTNKLTINGGWNTSGDIYFGLRASYYAGSYSYGFGWTEQNPTTNLYTNFAAVSRNPFYLDRNVSTIQPPPYEVGCTSNWLPNNATPLIPSYGGYFSTMPCVIGAYTAIGFAGDCFLMGGAVTPYLVAIPPGFMWPQMLQAGSNYRAQLTNHSSITDFEDAVNFPKPGTLTNYLFGFSGGTKISRVTWSIPTYVVNQLNVLGDDTIVFDSGSNLNAQLTKYGAIDICSPIGVRGFLATDLDAGIDYFVSIDGTKYWRIIYEPQAGAKAPATPNIVETNKKFVDSNGIFWYTGSTTINGSTIQPLFSLGANIPYGVFSLNFPPYSVPCYQDGCGNSLGIDWPGTGIYSTIKR